MRIFLLLFLLLLFRESIGQPLRNKEGAAPRLVVGIVVDQMRHDYLHRFNPLFGNDGFRRLLREGYSFDHARFNYQPTVTAVGHATIYTGAIPAIHGIPENNYYDRKQRQVVYVVHDPEVLTIGGAPRAGGASPFRLRSSTITDELKLASPASKVIGIALKDRSAVLPAGHRGDAALYFDDQTGNWVTSSWYDDRLPAWVQRWNDDRRSDHYVARTWELLLPRQAYAMCTGDTTAYERPLKGASWPAFPHQLKANDWKNMTATPFGNTITKDLAKEAIVHEGLGKDAHTDFLCISFSSPDIIGHAFGIHSLELADCYARLDRDLADLFRFLDQQIGMKDVLIFLTSDHGAAPNPLFAEEHQLPGGRLQAEQWLAAANAYLAAHTGVQSLVSAILAQQVYLNDSLLQAAALSPQQVAALTADFLHAQPGVQCVVAPRAGISTCPPLTESHIKNGYVADRSGDVLFALHPGWIDWPYPQGTSHLTLHPYDQHMPLIWMGWKVRHGSSDAPVWIMDIAPTLARWLGIPYPSGCVGNPLPVPRKP